MGPPASATKLSRRAALSAALLQPQVKLQRAIGTACAAGSTPEPRPCTLLAAIGEAARQLGNGLRHTRYKPQRSFMRACGISSFELAARVRCVWLLSSPLGKESRTPPSEGRLLGRLKNERLGSCCLQLRSSTRDPRRLTGSQETGIELATTCRARVITAQI